MQISFYCIKSFIGDLTVAEDSKGVCAILFKGEGHLNDYFPKAEIIKINSKSSLYADKVIRAVENLSKPDFPLSLYGTDFQKKVWKALLTVPNGKLVSYKDIAVKLGMPTAVRAVANACGANKMPIIIPCHRIIKSDGTIGGYSSGLDIKRRLLASEGISLE